MRRIWFLWKHIGDYGRSILLFGFTCREVLVCQTNCVVVSRMSMERACCGAFLHCAAGESRLESRRVAEIIPEAYTASYSMSIRISFCGKRGQGVVLTAELRLVPRVRMPSCNLTSASVFRA